MSERRKTVLNKREAKRKFPVFLTALLLCLWVQLPAPAYGSGSVGGEPLEDAQETDVVFPRIQGTRDVKTELMGNIEVSLISVTMPSDGFEFQIKPDHSFDAVTNPGGQILCPGPDSLKITNHSVVPVSVEIASVESLRDGDVVFQKKFTEGPEQRFRLVDRLADVKGYGTALLVLGKAGKPEINPYISDADFEQYAICPGKTGIPIAKLQAGESAGLQLYGTARADFYGEYQFTVKPILKISAVRAR